MELNTGLYNIEYMQKNDDVFTFSFMFNEGDDVAYIEYNKEKNEIEEMDFNILKEINDDFVFEVLELEEELKCIFNFLIALM